MTLPPDPSRAPAVGAVARSLKLALSLVGWLLFAYWWTIVLADTTARQLELTALALAVAALVILGVTVAWVAHNLRRARRGKRGGSSRFIAPVFERDHLGRTLELDRLEVRSAAVVIVSVAGVRKFYRAQALP